MKQIAIWVALFSLVFTMDALAQCSGNRIGDASGELSELLRGKLVSASGGGDTWNEVHCANGDLYEIAKGADDPVDPSKVVGSWDVVDQSTNGTTDELVCYSYSNGGTYCFRIFENAGGYSFCDGDVEKASAQIETGSCP